MSILDDHFNEQPIDLNVAATKLGITAHTCRKWVRSGKLKGFKLGSRTYRVYPSDLDAFIKSTEVTTVSNEQQG